MVELSKIRERYNHLTNEMLSDKLLSWMYLLIGGYARKDEVKLMMENIPEMEEFAERYGLAADDPKVKIAYEDFISARRERQSEKDFFERMTRESKEAGYKSGYAEGHAEGHDKGFSEGREEGRAEGRAEGRQEGRAEGRQEGRAEAFEEIAAALRNQGVDEDVLQSVIAAAESKEA